MNILIVFNVQQKALNLLLALLRYLPLTFLISQFLNVEPFEKRLNLLLTLIFLKKLFKFICWLSLLDTHSLEINLIFLIGNDSGICIITCVFNVRKENFSLFEIKENFHILVLFIFQNNCIVKNLLFVIVSLETIYLGSLQLSLTEVEIYLMGWDLALLSIHHYSFISKYQLTFFLITFRWSNWNVIPNHKFGEVSSNNNDFFIKTQNECFITNLIDSGFLKNTNLKNMVDDKNSRIGFVLVHLQFSQVQRFTFFLYWLSFCLLLSTKFGSYICSKLNWRAYKIKSI